MDDESGEPLSLKEALTKVGEFGRFQKFLCVIFFLMHIPVVMQILITVFLTTTPEWKCRENSTTCRLIGTTFSADDARRCDLPRDSWEYIGEKEFSLTTQFDVHCQSFWMVMFISSLVFFGHGIGAMFIGYIADNFGRKKILFPCFSGLLVIGSLSTLLPNINLIMASRLLIGICLQGTSFQGMIIVSELIGAKYRPLATIFILSAAGIGWCIMSLQSYLIQNWKYFTLVCTLPYTLIIPLLLFVPESIEWLQIRGKQDQVLNVLCTIGKYNGKDFPQNLKISPSGASATTNDSNKKSSPTDLFRTWKQALETCRISYVWIVTIMSYFGMYIAANQLGGSLYRDFAILSILDLPGVPLSILICKKIGRKACVIYPLLFGSIICISTGLIPNENGWLILRVTFGVVGSFFFSLTFSGLYIWSVELFPTEIRSTGMGFVVLCSRVGSGIVPWIVGELNVYGSWCSFVALGIPSFIGFFVGFPLNETKCTGTVENVTSVNGSGEIDNNTIFVNENVYLPKMLMGIPETLL